MGSSLLLLQRWGKGRYPCGESASATAKGTLGKQECDGNPGLLVCHT